MEIMEDQIFNWEKAIYYIQSRVDCLFTWHRPGGTGQYMHRNKDIGEIGFIWSSTTTHVTISKSLASPWCPCKEIACGCEWKIWHKIPRLEKTFTKAQFYKIANQKQQLKLF